MRVTTLREPFWRTHAWQLFVGFPLMLCAWVLFLYVGVRGRHTAWTVTGVAYLAATAAAIAIASTVEHGSVAIGVVWIAGLAHALIVKPAAENRLEVIERFRRAGAYE